MAEPRIEYQFKMTLLANGVPSGPAYISASTWRADTQAEFAASGNWPFQNAADTYRAYMVNTTYIHNFVHGYITVTDAMGRPVMNHVPFCAYVGDVWPQAPLGIVHGAKPDCIDDGFVLYSVIIERP